MRALTTISRPDRIDPIITVPGDSPKRIRDNETRKNDDALIVNQLHKLLSPGGFFVGFQARGQVIFDNGKAAIDRNKKGNRFNPNPEPDAIGHDLIITHRKTSYRRLLMPRYIKGQSHNGIYFKLPSDINKKNTKEALKFLRNDLDPVFLVIKMIPGAQYTIQPLTFQGISGESIIHDRMIYWTLYKARGNKNRMQYTSVGLLTNDGYSLLDGKKKEKSCPGLFSILPDTLLGWFIADMENRIKR